MYSAPAVSFPVGRSRFQGLFLGSLLAFGVATCVAWTNSVAVMGWRQMLAAGLLLMGGLYAWRTLQHGATGLLKWDGQSWHFGSGGLAGQLAVRLDLQFFMLLAFRVGTGRTQWLWLDRSRDSARWLALRRAVYGDTRKDTAHTLEQTDTWVGASVLPEPRPKADS